MTKLEARSSSLHGPAWQKDECVPQLDASEWCTYNARLSSRANHEYAFRDDAGSRSHDDAPRAHAREDADAREVA